MKNRNKLSIASVVILVSALACNLSSPAGTDEAPTQEVVTVVVTATPETAPATEETASDTKATATLNQDLNVRGGPGTNYPIIVSLPGGTAVDILGKNADASWWFIAFNGNTGWVSAPFVASVNTENVPLVDAPAPAPQSNSSGNSNGGNSNGGNSGGNGSGNGGGNNNGGGGQSAPADNDDKVTVSVKGDNKSLNGSVSYPSGDSADAIFVTVGGFDSVKTSGNVTYSLTCSGGNPKVTSVGGAVKNGSPGCNQTWTVFYTNESSKETIKIKLDSNGYVNWTLVISAGN